MTQTKNNLEAFNRQLSAGHGGAGATGVSGDTRSKSKFKPANASANGGGSSQSQGTHAFRPTPVAQPPVRKTLQTFSSPSFGKGTKVATPQIQQRTATHSQPVYPSLQQQQHATSMPRVQSATSRFTPSSIAASGSPAPRVSAGGTIDLSPSGSESSTRTMARKRMSMEVPLLAPNDVKRLRMSPQLSERGSPVNETARNEASRMDKGKAKEPSSSLASSATLYESHRGSQLILENEDLPSKSVAELQKLAMYNMETVADLKKSRKMFDFQLKTDQDAYLLDAFMSLAESRAQAIDNALIQCVGGDVPQSQSRSALQAHGSSQATTQVDTQVLGEDELDIPPSPPPSPPHNRFGGQPSSRSLDSQPLPHNDNLSNGSLDASRRFEPDNDIEFIEVNPAPQPSRVAPRLVFSPEPEPDHSEPASAIEREQEQELEPEVFEIPSDDEAELWNYGPTTQELEIEPNAIAYGTDIEVVDGPSTSATTSVDLTRQPSALVAEGSTRSLAPIGNFDAKRSPHYREVMRVLSERFKLRTFRQNQLEAIISTLDGKDVFMLMPTGGGKSLCFQLPAVVSRGVTVVISPLIALMLDQTRELEQLGIQAVWYNQNQSFAEQNQVTQALLAPENDKPDLLYVTPERIAASSQMGNILTGLNQQGLLARFVIDEAHLLHTWSRNFRNSFLGLGQLRKKFPNVPIMALTATATPVAQEDIIQILGLRPDTLRLKHGFNRANLFYRVLPKPRNMAKEIATFIKAKHSGKSGIVYCGGRDKCEKVAELLCKEGIKAKYFHAEMAAEDKPRVYEAWKTGVVHVVVATIAFGMGINKADVRFVVHHDVPSSMSGYLQETGRAGRDGLNSECVMYYSYQDSQMQFRRIRELENVPVEERNRLEAEVRDIIEFAMNTCDCRRTQLLARFDEPFTAEQCARTCDNCERPGAIRSVDVTQAAIDMVRLQHDAEQHGVTRIPRGALLAAYRGKSPKDVVDRGMPALPSFGLGKDVEAGIPERIFEHLVALNGLTPYVEITKAPFPTSYVRLGNKANLWLSGMQTLVLKTRDAPPKAKRAAAGTRTNSRKKAARAELPSDPIEEDEPPSRSLWQDDEEGDPDFAPEIPVAGPSRTRSAPTRTAATGKSAWPPKRGVPPEPAAEVEIPEPSAGEDWHAVAYRTLKKLREEFTQGGVLNSEDVLPDDCLELLSTMLPADGAEVMCTLSDGLGDEGLANDKFRLYGQRLTDVCSKYHARAFGSAPPSTPTAAPVNRGKQKFKPARTDSEEPALPSASQLHRSYDYQATPKPSSRVR